MELTVTELEGPVTRMRLDGRLDAPGADAVGLRFTAAPSAPGRRSVVAHTGVSVVASMGIRLPIPTARRVHQKGGRMVLFGATELVQGVLDGAALAPIIPIAGTQVDAVGELTR